MKCRYLFDSVVIACVAFAGICILLCAWSRPSGAGSKSQQQLKLRETAGAITSEFTGLGLELKGTVVTGFDGYNLAVIEYLGKQGVYREGDRVGGVRIQKVFRNKALVRVVDRDALLVMDFQRDSGDTATVTKSRPDTPRPAKPSVHSISPDRKELLSSVEDVQGLMKSARLHPRVKGNTSAGFLVTSIKPGSLLAKMGLRNGDTIVGVNGEPITSVEQAVHFYKSLVDGEKIVLEIRRRGTQEPVELVVE